MKKCYSLDRRYTFYLIGSIITLVLLIDAYLIFKLANDSPISATNQWLNANINVSNYLFRAKQRGNDVLAQHPHLCTQSIDILIGVVSTPSHTEARRAIRNSYGRNLPSTWQILFFLGRFHGTDLEKEIEEENEKFRDIAELDVDESYNNLSIKVILLLQFVSDYCPQSTFLLKIDDDVFLNILNLNSLINCSLLTLNNMYSANSQAGCDKWKINNIIGHYIDSKTNKYINYLAAGYLYDSVYTDRDPSSKWYLSPSIYPKPKLPQFLSGTAYLMTVNLIPNILDTAKNTRLINLEDVYITGIIMRQKLNLKLSNIDGWSNFRPRWDDTCLYRTLLTAHGLNPEELQSITADVLNPNITCGVIDAVFSFVGKQISYYIPRYKL